MFLEILAMGKPIDVNHPTIVRKIFQQNYKELKMYNFNFSICHWSFYEMFFLIIKANIVAMEICQNDPHGVVLI